MLKDKKAISAVVATIMIILVAIIAVTILWAALRPGIESGAESVETASQCFYLNLNIVNISYDDAGNELLIKIQREPGIAELNYVRFIDDGTEIDSTSISPDNSGPGELESKTYTITGYTSDPTGDIEVAGVIKGGITCDVSDTYLLVDIYNL